jgi:plastocyanin
MRRTAVLLAAGLAVSASLSADVVTLPAAASIQGGNPFFSDARVFNTSYSASLDVTGTYRCFIATVACPAVAPQIHFTLAPRESRAFNDICAAAFGAPDTAGGVEFEFSGSEDQFVVTSRLYSTSPLNSVGMFIPGLTPSKAHPKTILTSIRHDPLTGIVPGFRTNVGAFNPGDVSTTVAFTILDVSGAELAPAVVRSLLAHSGVQVSGIFEAAGLANLSTENATIAVSAAVPVFSYAAVLDNRTADPIFVLGALDQSSQAVTPTQTQSGPTPTRTRTLSGVTATSTRTPTLGGPTATATSTRTPTQPGPTSTPTPTVPGATNTPTSTRTATSTFTATATRTPTNTRTPTSTPLPNQVNIGPGIAFSPSTITINAGETVNWVWMSGPHSTTSGSCPGGVCAPDGIWDSMIHSPPQTFSHTFPAAGTFTYYCRVHLASMQGTVVVNP